MLKSLELFGFKSFADRTRFEFAPGITCVVGPNGSGKSNVVDSIKWILGDQSPKSLRGSEMTDVIFNGASGRKPTGFAEATLTFDNRNRLLNFDADEVLVGRRIYRTGEAEYLINRTVARLKDVKDLFLDTGAGTIAYSIIEQGRVDALLQATQQNRRVVFEEAAGISKYKVRRIEAQRKLERVDQNLVRLKDIVDEIFQQLETLRNQASRAARFREVSEELRTLRVGLAADDFRELTAKTRQVLEELGQLTRKLEELTDQHAQIELEQSQVERELSDHQSTTRELEKLSSSCREAIAGLDSTLHHLRSRLGELKQEKGRLAQQKQELSERVEAVASELFALEEQSQQANEALLQARQQLEGVGPIEDPSSRLKFLKDRFEQARSARLKALQRQMELEQQRNTCRSLLADRTQSIERLQARSAQLQESKLLLDSEVESLRDQVGVSSPVEGGSASGLLRELFEKKQAIERESQQLTELRELRGELAARKKILEEAEEQDFSFGMGVKEILSRSRSTDLPPWNSVLGTIADLLSPRIEYAPLFEAILGAKSDWIVIDRGTNWWELLDQGKFQAKERIGFLALDEHSRTDSSPDLTGEPGVVCKALDLLLPETSDRRVAERLLSDAWIVETLGVGQHLSKHYPQLQFCTLQGDFIDSLGGVQTGPIRSEHHPHSPNLERRRLKQEWTQLVAKIEESESRLLQLNQQSDDISSSLAQENLDSTSERNTTRARLQTAELTARQYDIQLEELAKELATLEAEAARLQAQIKLVEENSIKLVDELFFLENEETAARDSVEEAERESSNRESDHQAARFELSRHEERARSIMSTRERLDNERYERSLQCEEAENREGQVTARITLIQSQISETEQQGTKLHEENARLESEIQGRNQVHESLRSRRSVLLEREASYRKERRDLEDRKHRGELTVREIEQKLAHLGERVREEFQMEIEQAAQSGATALGVGVERAEVEENIEKLRRKIRAIGTVNTDTLRDLDELEGRHKKLSEQMSDLIEAKVSLEEIIQRINKESERLFLETFHQIRTNFRELFRKLFGGGEGDIVLEDPNDVLDCSIEIVARPPGKELRSITLLSGGEKTLTAVALLLAMFMTRPSPFCILDEVDAALDEGNVERYMRVIDEFRQTTQFIVITHSKRTMTIADVLYGVTMEESGVSKRISIRFEDVTEGGHIKAA